MRDRKPNILLLMTDQQRPDSLGCYGNAVASTPNLDRLGREGVVFDNMYVQNPLCVPSRYSMLTGRYPHTIGVRTNWDGHPGKGAEFRRSDRQGGILDVYRRQDASYGMAQHLRIRWPYHRRG